MKKITNDIIYVGVNDHNIDLFEGQYVVPNGIAYNSYVIKDEKIAIMDTVDKNFIHEWLDNISEALDGKNPDYLVIQHMEPDHSANILNFLKVYPNCTLVGNAKIFKMMSQFFGKEIEKYLENKVVVNDMDTLSLGKHTLTFVFAPMVHWPEVMVTYDSYDKVLFSADGFGKFGALDVEEDWVDEARRYYIGIVGKYGQQVQTLLKKAKTLDIQIICPLHGPVLDSNLGYYLNLYDLWSSYTPETEGILLAYTSIYGNTKKAVMELAEKLKNYGAPNVVVYDLARDDMSKAIGDAFKYSKIVLATTTYNASIFPFMNTFIEGLVERSFQNRVVGIIENGSWAPMAAKIIKGKLAECKNLTILNPTVKIMSSLNEESAKDLEALAKELTSEYTALQNVKESKNDLTALFNIGYGLYVVTSNDGKKDNGLIVNTVSQVTNDPLRVMVTINKENYSHHVVKQTKKMNVNCLSVEAPFSVFERFGFVSGRNVDKFENCEPLRSNNGLVVLPKNINAFLSLEVVDYVDLGTHGMFICSVTESKNISNKETMTYTYYQNNVKPKPDTSKKGWVCKVCGFVYEGEELPEDYICPLCKHGAVDFEKL